MDTKIKIFSARVKIILSNFLYPYGCKITLVQIPFHRHLQINKRLKKLTGLIF